MIFEIMNFLVSLILDVSIFGGCNLEVVSFGIWQLNHMAAHVMPTIPVLCL